MNWFTDPGLSRGAQDRPGGLNRVHRFVFGRSARRAGAAASSTAQRMFLLALLIGIVLVSVSSHRRHPVLHRRRLPGAGAVAVRRCPSCGYGTLRGCWVVTWLSFAVDVVGFIVHLDGWGSATWAAT